MDGLESYYNNTQSPWGKMFYKIVWEQLSFAKTLKIMDFGSGFGITSEHFAASNTVVAIEPNAKMCEMSFKANDYTQIIGGIEALNSIPEESFDLILCHNVLEYIENKEDYISHFCRLLKCGGKLSLVKHNRAGRILHKVVYENNIDEAINLIDGGTSSAQYFGDIKYYEKSDIDKWSNSYGLKISDIMGIRTFFALHPDNTIRSNEDWFNPIFELEIKASRIKHFIDIASFNHVILEKA